MDLSYWQKQTASEPLFPDIEWNRPQRRDLAGKLAIIGGNKLGFAAAAESYQTAKELEIGEARVLLPDALSKSIPASMSDVVFASTNLSGGLAKEATTEINSLENWADTILLCGDSGKNSQTATLYEELAKNSQQTTVITRDAIDLLQNSFPTILDNHNLVFVASFAQAQKMFKEVYYPKILTFNMQLLQFVEAIHKFTTTYPITLCVLFKNQLLVAHGGEVVSQNWSEPMAIWRGTVAAKAACYLTWSPNAPLAAISASLIKH
ncbi:hypothetical protein CR969_00850 [Candidatus Saccharibacteria bacterium]|nr:MAG: hypothetical protein CR969_00850 [Candidatus Saccharibacteria bacterium]